MQPSGPALTCRAVKANAELQKDLFGDAGVLEQYVRASFLHCFFVTFLSMYRVKLAEALGALLDGMLAENERVGEEKVRAK